MQNNVTYATPKMAQINFSKVYAAIFFFFTIKSMLYYGFDI